MIRYFLELYIRPELLLKDRKLQKTIVEKDQVQASEQFLATTKLPTNKAICLKTKINNKCKMYFYIFLAINNECITVNAYLTH